MPATNIITDMEAMAVIDEKAMSIGSLFESLGRGISLMN